MTVLRTAPDRFDAHVPIAIIGAGACGLTAALAARDAGVDVMVLERDSLPRGSTALSSGMIPACASHLQRQAGIADSVAVMAADIQRKAGDEVEPGLLETVCKTSGPTIDWLMQDHAVALTLVEGFLYPGHSYARMHAPASKSGRDLIDSLLQAAQRADCNIVCDAHVTALYASAQGTIEGLRLSRPDGSSETLGCAALLLACNGYGGNPELVRRFIPEIADALYFGHAGNRGDAVLWGRALGADVRHMGAYQGHGSVATPHGILITWALMMEGGIQVNVQGRRFSNEHRGYSEQAVAVLAQPGAIAWNVYDQRLHELGLSFEDYRNASDLGAIKSAADVPALAQQCDLPAAALQQTLSEVERFRADRSTDPLGRSTWSESPLHPPYYAVNVTGALFHTQGGLLIDSTARVLRADRSALPNLFAAGGAACGLSGSSVAGYLSGNGLLSAVVLGRIAGQAAAGYYRVAHTPA